jgi:hypothetical protein
MELNDHIENIISPTYQHPAKFFQVEKPLIPTGYIYHFSTSSGLLYEVRFARKQDNVLGIVVNFSVLSDEFDNEYSVTNRGEIYSVIATVIEIIRIFHNEHHLSDSYEFSGEFKENETKETASIRTRLYLRYASKVLSKGWMAELQGNKVILKKG